MYAFHSVERIRRDASATLGSLSNDDGDGNENATKQLLASHYKLS